MVAQGSIVSGIFNFNPFCSCARSRQTSQIRKIIAFGSALALTKVSIGCRTGPPQVEQMDDCRVYSVAKYSSSRCPLPYADTGAFCAKPTADPTREGPFSRSLGASGKCRSNVYQRARTRLVCGLDRHDREASDSPWRRPFGSSSTSATQKVEQGMSDQNSPISCTRRQLCGFITNRDLRPFGSHSLPQRWNTQWPV